MLNILFHKYIVSNRCFLVSKRMIQFLKRRKNLNFYSQTFTFFSNIKHSYYLYSQYYYFKKIAIHKIDPQIK